MKSIIDFKKFKASHQKISMVTCYDAWSAAIINNSHIDTILVGDSVAMVVHGFDSTLHADVPMIALHTRAVSRKAPSKFITSDMPFMSVQKGIKFAMESAEILLKSGAQAVKIEGLLGHKKVIRKLVLAGVPVMAHLGLTPQSIHQLGGYRVQGKNQDQAEEILQQAQILQDLGCFALVLECVPTHLSKKLSESLDIPTIGIGAGPHCDGQVLVLQDLLGAQTDVQPRFIRKYTNVSENWLKQLNQFDQDIKTLSFPNQKESYLWQ